jgi:tetratricopeptide (TPR) repeat protein
LLSPILPNDNRLLSIQPTLPFFLRSKLAGWDEAARSGLRQAFKQHYLHFAHDCYKFINSRELQDQQIGVHACYFQYENLAYCLELFLTNTEENFLDIYACLVSYLKATENRRERLRLSHSVYTYLETKQLEQVTDEFKFNTLTVYDVIASEYTQERKYKEARLAYEKILGFLCDLKIIPNEERQQLIAAKLHCLGGVNLEEREYDNARQRYNEALRIFIQIKDRHSEANTYHQLGILAQTQSISKDDSYFKDALDSYEKAIHIFSELSDLYRLALTLSQEGTLYQNAEIYENAGLNFDKALHIFTLIGAKSDQAKIYRQLGVIEQSQQRMKSARNYYQKALKYFVELEDRYSQSFVYHQIGILSEDMDEPEEAQDNYQKALEIFTEFNDLHSQATTYCALGNVAMSRKNWSESQANHLKALKIWIDFSDEYRVKTYSLSNIQRLYQQTQDETLLIAAANLLGTTPDDLRQIFTTQ